VEIARVFFLALNSWGCRAQGRGQSWVCLECHDVSYFTKALRKSNTQHTRELLGGYQERKPGDVVRNLGGITPSGGCRKLPSHSSWKNPDFGPINFGIAPQCSAAVTEDIQATRSCCIFTSNIDCRNEFSCYTRGHYPRSCL